ncbi:MAG: PIG-L family deacetylase [Vampirovibrionales bacterium]|nr:PIG-L family deacetylase [Vampirovibrionales bacterium]
MSRVLALVAHPDDEILGVGGALARHAKRRDEVFVAILAEGVTSRVLSSERASCGEALSALARAARAANDILGVQELVLGDFADNRMDERPRLDVIRFVEGLFQRFQPDIVYTHAAHDVNIDHRRVHEATVTACRPLPGCCVKRLLFFETPSSTEWRPPASATPFAPDWFVDISETLSQKLEALSAYACEMRPWPHARSLEAVTHLARWRGASVGVDAAEAFVLGRMLE